MSWRGGTFSAATCPCPTELTTATALLVGREVYPTDLTASNLWDAIVDRLAALDLAATIRHTWYRDRKAQLMHDPDVQNVRLLLLVASDTSATPF